MAPRKRQRKSSRSAPAAPPPALPVDLLLEIAGRSDATTLVRCAAACRLLRRRIFTDTFMQKQATAVMPCWAVFRLHISHPCTPDPSFVDKHLAPFVSPAAADLLRQYHPISSCRSRSLVMLSARRRRLKRRKSSGRRSWKEDYGYAYA